MPKRIALGAIGVTRDGKTVYPPVGDANSGTPFDFTNEELNDIRALEKASGNQLVRKILNENVAPADDGEGDEGKALSEMTVKELQAEAASREIDLGAAKTKAEILAVIEAAGEDL